MGVSSAEAEKKLTVSARDELVSHILPFWEGLRDDSFGGYYGYLDYDLNLDKKAVKGCILNSRITWFFSNASKTLGDPALLSYAEHGYDFLVKHCLDREHGGVFWSVSYDGKPEDTTKHTYNQAFSIYALSSYYDAAGNREALDLALELFRLIESKMKDEGGYLEAFDRDFSPVSNDKLSENGVIAERTMNTILHVIEAYTELLRVSGDPEVRKALEGALNILEEKIYNPEQGRLEVFMDHDYHTLLDLWSYGHDIEAAWLVDRAVDVLEADEKANGSEPSASSASDDTGKATQAEKTNPADRLHNMTSVLTRQVYQYGFDGHSIPAEIEKGVVKQDRVWWVQCEGVNGFLEGYQRDHRSEYLDAAHSIWQYIQDYVIDRRPGSEWYWYVNPDGTPAQEPIVEPWKCPYHNGRTCMEVIRRGID